MNHGSAVGHTPTVIAYRLCLPVGLSIGDMMYRGLCTVNDSWNVFVTYPRLNFVFAASSVCANVACR